MISCVAFQRRASFWSTFFEERTVTSPGGGGGGGGGFVTIYFKYQDNRMGAKIKPPKLPTASNKTKKESPGRKITPKKSHAEFPSL